jgi:hypothetical protein
MKRIALALCASLALVVGVAAATASNSDAAHACQQNGWQNLFRQDGTAFANQSECVSYAAQGGTLRPGVTAPPLVVNGCSVTVKYTPNLDTFLYGVNGHKETDAITGDVTVTGSLSGADNTAPQFWIGYKAHDPYVLANPTTAPSQYDFNYCAV